MLAADKLQLQSALKQQATALKEKEFNLHHSNLMTVGTQAAVLAGLDITMFIEFNPPHEREWGAANEKIARFLKVLYYGIIVAAFCANMLVVSHTTALSVLGAGLALRGPDGSMMTATDGLYEERKSVFRVFGLGLALTLGSVLVSVWLLLRWEAALVAWMVTLWTCRKMYSNYQRVCARFDYDESETVDFSDIMNGPAAIRGVPMQLNYVNKKALSILQAVPVKESGRTWYGSKKADREEPATAIMNGNGSDASDEAAELLFDDSERKDVRRRQNVSSRKKLDPMQTV